MQTIAVFLDSPLCLDLLRDFYISFANPAFPCIPDISSSYSRLQRPGFRFRLPPGTQLQTAILLLAIVILILGSPTYLVRAGAAIDHLK
jgi:hypothetical protein